MNLQTALQEKQKHLTVDCLDRIDHLRVLLNHIEHQLLQKSPLNTLGELQGFCAQLDCHIATVGLLRELIG